jgi:hypothetical protein
MLPMGMDALGHNGTMAGKSYKLELGGAWLEVVRVSWLAGFTAKARVRARAR